MATSTINISLPDTMKSAVEEAIATEGYGNTSEFFRDLVRNYLKTRQEQQLETLLLKRLNDKNMEEFDVENAQKALKNRLDKKR
ncbi:MAG: ribbon-helix-helix protein, CopG family [Acidobacteriota bacterium]|nr:ribbon-helix-helix protein, CopG family [Acidobacteriota bacterium]